MNVPGVFRKALDGFIIPPRTFTEMLYSAGSGVMKLMDVEKRNAFIDRLDKGTINEEVMSQASSGPMVILSLFNDLENPLFKQYQFDAPEFLAGVKPALERFHNVSGSLENQLRKIQADARTNNNNTTAMMGSEDPKTGSTTSDASASNDEGTAATDKTVDDVITLAFSKDDIVRAEIKGDTSTTAVLEHSWKDDAEKDPESLAGQFSRMVTSELLDLHQMSAKAAFLLQSDRDVKFKEGSCTVNHVALISARAFRCAEKAPADDIEGWGERTDWKYELIDYDIDESELKKLKGGVAAQLEVLYDVTQEFISSVPVGEEKNDESKEKVKTEVLDTTIVSVAVLEGWLSGGPDDQLRWRIALHRPAFEFPSIQHGM